MDRYTRKDAEQAFIRLCEVLGKRVATSYKDVGGWRLDYNATYGGCVVEEVANESGGITQPLGSQRRTPREFWDACYFVARSVEVASWAKGVTYTKDGQS